MAHFAPACAASNDKQMDPSHGMKMGSLFGHNMFHIPNQLPPASVFIESAENSGPLIVIYKRVFSPHLPTLSSSVAVNYFSSSDLCSVFKEESLAEARRERYFGRATRAPPTPR